eukprot:9714913-Alexandrium_andersonii.AAC.1
MPARMCARTHTRARTHAGTHAPPWPSEVLVTPTQSWLPDDRPGARTRDATTDEAIELGTG